MDEVRFGVVPDTADAQTLCGITQMRELNARNADVDGFAFHVQAVHGDAFAGGMELGIAFGRAVTGDHLETLIHAELVAQQDEGIEQPRIDLVNGVGAVIA